MGRLFLHPETPPFRPIARRAELPAGSTKSPECPALNAVVLSLTTLLRAGAFCWFPCNAIPWGQYLTLMSALRLRMDGDFARKPYFCLRISLFLMPEGLLLGRSGRGPARPSNAIHRAWMGQICFGADTWRCKACSRLSRHSACRLGSVNPAASGPICFPAADREKLWNPI